MALSLRNFHNKLPMESLFGDLDAVLPAHADLDPGNGSEMVGLHLGARLRATGGGHPAAPVPARLVLHRGHLGLGPADLQLLPRPDDLVLVVLALGAVPIVVRDRLQRRVQTEGVVVVLALVAHERQVIPVRDLRVANLAGALLAIDEGCVVEAFVACCAVLA